MFPSEMDSTPQPLFTLYDEQQLLLESMDRLEAARLNPPPDGWLDSQLSPECLEIIRKIEAASESSPDHC
jgi:hypothetical protein